MKGQDKKFILQLNNAFALFGAKDDLLSIINNDKQSMPETIKQLEDWNYDKAQKIDHDLYGENGAVKMKQKEAQEIQSELLDRADKFNKGKRIKVVVIHE